MKHPNVFAGPAACLLLSGGLAFAETGSEASRSYNINAYMDMGHIMEGSAGPEADAFDYEGVYLSRTAISILFRTSVEDRLHLKVGVGGLFYRAFPIDQQQFWTKGIRFGPGISETSFQYDFLPQLSLKGGFFGYKYNMDAQNLGEYLLRSECYPSLVQTGGWSWLNSAGYQTLGAQLRWSAMGGAWTNDALLVSSFDETPAWDMSPAFVSTLRVGNVLELGSGFSFHRLLAVKPSAEAPDHLASTYYETDNFPTIPTLVDTAWIDDAGPHDATNVKSVRVRQAGFQGGPGTTFKAIGSHMVTPANVVKYVDAEGNPIATAFRDADGNVAFVTAAGDTLRPRTTKLSFQGIKLMARASVDFKPLLGLENLLGPKDLKLFAEAAVLGIENQPYYYEDIMQRIPIMFGLNMPTFGLLDVLSLQFQYFKNPWPDSKQMNLNPGLPIPADLATRDEPTVYQDRLAEGAYSGDDWKWSVNATRTLTKGLQMQVQAANDHFRLRKWNNEPSAYPLTNQKGHWYYVVRLQWGV